MTSLAIQRMRALWKGESMFALVDPAAGEAVRRMIGDYPENKFCVVQGWQQEMFAGFSPWLLSLKIERPSFEALIHQSWGKSRAIFLCSSLPPAKLLDHFYQIWLVSSPDGSRQYFRYYDPRVFRSFFQVALVEQLNLLFCDGLHAFYAESEDGKNLHCYDRKERGLMEKFAGYSLIKEWKVQMAP